MIVTVRGLERDVAILVLLHLIIGLVYLDAVPRYFDDESWEASLGYSLATEGRLRNLAMVGCGGMEIRFVQTRIVLPLACGGAYALVGDRGAATCRVVSVLMGALAVVATWALARRWFGRGVALASGLLLISNFWFFEVTRRIRPEIYYLALGACGLWALVAAVESKRRASAAVAGVFLALTVLSHPMGWSVAIAAGGGVLLAHDGRALLRILPWVALGAAIPLAAYLAYLGVSVQIPGVDYFEQMRGCRAQAMPQMERYFSRALHAWSFFFQLPKGAPLAAVWAAAWLAACFGPTRGDRTLAATSGLLVLLFPYGKGGDFRFATALTPLFAVLVARLVERLWESARGAGDQAARARRVAAALVAAVYLGTGVGGILLFFHHLRGADLEALLDRIGAVVGPTARLHGESLFWLGHARYAFVPRVYTEDDEYVAWLRAQRPEYVIRTAWHFPSGHSITSPPAAMPADRASPIDRVCRDHGLRVAAFRDPYFGPVEIYRMDWGSLSSPSP